MAAVRELTGGHGAHAVIEAVGTEQSMRTAMAVTRDGGAVGYVGVPHGSGTGLDLSDMFARNVSLRGGVAPVRSYIPELLPDILDGTVDPSPVFDLTVGLDGVPGGYKAMDERVALKVLVRPEPDTGNVQPGRRTPGGFPAGRSPCHAGRVTS